MELTSIVPWGRSLHEYKSMFSLNPADLQRKILGCGDGPASFNSELTKLGGHVVSVDPIYQFNSEKIRSRIDTVYPEVISQVEKNKNKYFWDSIANVEALGQTRMEAMEIFLNDVDSGIQSGRYINASLPTLPFKNNEFELALCSHYLFLYSKHVNQEEHLFSIKELCRVANEVRIYPLLTLDGSRSKYLKPVISLLESDGFRISLESVSYQFQKGATEMMVVQKNRVNH